MTDPTPSSPLPPRPSPTAIAAPTAPPGRPDALPRTPPGAGTAFALLYRTLLRSVRTRGRVICLIVLVALGVVSALISGARTDVASLEQGLDHAALSLTQLVAIGALVVASAVLGDLYDNGSIVYVVLRPLPSWVVAAAAWAAAVTIVLPAAIVAALTVVVVHGGDGLVGASLLAAVLATVAYSALFGFLGVLVRRALPAGLAFLVLWEGFVSFAGKAGAALSVTGYLRSVLARITEVELEGAPFALPTAIVLPLVISIVAIVATGWLLGRRELP